MTPGPIIYIKCPHCGGRARYSTLNSGNSFGARTWTDGKQIAPMLPMPPAVVKCARCPGSYWLSDAEEIGEFDPWENQGSATDPSWNDAEWVEEPTEEEYATVLNGSLMNSQDTERSLRILAWWRANEPYRLEPDSPEPPSRTHHESFRANLENLVGLMDESKEDDLLMKGEILRELGRFTEADTVLKRVTSPAYKAVAQQLRSLCVQQDTGVRELQFDA
jgi:hypothetical protein